MLTIVNLMEIAMLGRTRVALSVIFTLVGLHSVAVYGATEPATIRVQGQSELRLAPEAVVIRLSAESLGPDPVAIKADLDAQVGAFHRALTRAELGFDRYQAQQLVAYPIPPDCRLGPATCEAGATQYQLRRPLQLRLLATDKLDKLLALAANAGLLVQSTEVVLLEPERARQRALSEAMANARERANAVLLSEQRSAGAALNIEVEQGYSPMPAYAMRAAAESASGSYQAGEVTVAASVTVTFALE